MVEWKFLNEICDIYDGTHQTPKYKDFGIRFVSVENIYSPYSSQKFISEEDYSNNYKTKPQKGDVLMTRIGDIGTCAVLDSISIATKKRVHRKNLLCRRTLLDCRYYILD